MSITITGARVVVVATIAEPVTVLDAGLCSARDTPTVTVADEPEDNPVTATSPADRAIEPDVDVRV